MKELGAELETIVNGFIAFAYTYTNPTWQEKSLPHKWSKNEVVGHLVDSANNNIQRFVRGTHEEAFRIVYQQNEWVKVQHYNKVPTKELLVLWKHLNLQIARILAHYPDDKQVVTSDIGQTTPEILTMEQLARGYIDHLRHHLRQIGYDPN